jgi:hypothetical protein
MSPGSGARAGVAHGAVLPSLALAALGAFSLGACGEEDKRIGDTRIVESLKLEQLDSAYAIGGDPFCSVEPELLNDEDEVDEVLDADEEAPVITSRAGNVGVEAVPPFGPDCQRQARKRLNRLDPVPKDE